MHGVHAAALAQPSAAPASRLAACDPSATVAITANHALDLARGVAGPDGPVALPWPDVAGVHVRVRARTDPLGSQPAAGTLLGVRHAPRTLCDGPPHDA